MKFLSAIYDAMSRDCDECFEPDPVSKRDKWLLDRDNGNVLAVAMRALSKGCGADISKCDGNDLLHDFDLDDGMPTPTANHDYTTIKCRLRYRVKCRTGSTTKKKKKTDER